MKLLRIETKGKIRIAAESRSALWDVTALMPGKRADLKHLVEAGPSACRRLEDSIKRSAAELEKIPRRGSRILAPYTNPEKIACVALNYMDHCREQNVQPPPKPNCFSKLPSAIIGPGEAILHPRITEMLDYEGELAVIIGREAKHIPEERALEYVFGYSIMNDVTARDLQRSETQWLRAKGGDTFAPFGPAIVTADEIPDPQNVPIRTWLNGELVQDSSTREMIFSVRKLIAFLSEIVTLRPGDILSTGTPHGVGVYRNPRKLMKPGDKVRIELPGSESSKTPSRRSQIDPQRASLD